jgi:hypothetical protein
MVTRTIRAGALLLALAAAHPAAAQWTRAGTSQEQRSQDLVGCELSARQTLARDRSIGQDIAGARQPDPLIGGTGNAPTATGEIGVFGTEVTRYQESRSRQRLISECMQGRGYVLPED